MNEGAPDARGTVVPDAPKILGLNEYMGTKEGVSMGSQFTALIKFTGQVPIF